MTTYLISRHPGAIAWLKRTLHAPDAQVLQHVDEPLPFRPGDIVAGVLPLRLAAGICACGAVALSLDMDVSAAQRGRELSAEELDAAGARLTVYDVRRSPYRGPREPVEDPTRVVAVP